MSASLFSPVREHEHAGALDTLVSAFADDPVERWLYPESLQYLTHFAAFVAAFGGKAFEEHTVWRLGEFSAVAMWLPPGTEADGDVVTSVLIETVATRQHADPPIHAPCPFTNGTASTSPGRHNQERARPSRSW